MTKLVYYWKPYHVKQCSPDINRWAHWIASHWDCHFDVTPTTQPMMYRMSHEYTHCFVMFHVFLFLSYLLVNSRDSFFRFLQSCLAGIGAIRWPSPLNIKSSLSKQNISSYLWSKLSHLIQFICKELKSSSGIYYSDTGNDIFPNVFVMPTMLLGSFIKKI